MTKDSSMRAAVEAMEAFDHELSSWAQAYPLTAFPEPDLKVARLALQAAGLTLDSVSASNMRHVVVTLNTDFDKVRSALSLLRSAIDQGEPEEQARALHQQIMNLPCKVPGTRANSSAVAYTNGHRDARHAAAELVLANSSIAAPKEEGEPDEDERWAVDRGADFLEQYAGYIRTVHPDDIERHPYLPELEEVAEQLRALYTHPAAPLHRNHLPDLRYVLLTLEHVVPVLKKDPELRGQAQAAINGMRYIIKRTEEASPSLNEPKESSNG